MAVAIARHCGARHIVVTDVNDYRLALAAKMGASKALNVSRESLDDAMRDLGMEEGIYGREMFETWYKMSSMLQSGLDVRPVITHRLGINDYREGFEIMNSGKSGKITLDWSSL